MTYLKDSTKKHPMVLVIDDEPDLSEVLTTSLELDNIRVKSFTKPFDLLEYLHKHSTEIELIITDYHMPKLTGLEMMKMIHMVKEIPYILVSGRLDAINDSYKKNEIARLEKPYCYEGISKRISKLLLSYAFEAEESG